jgi:hypothetical protein
MINLNSEIEEESRRWKGERGWRGEMVFFFFCNDIWGTYFTIYHDAIRHGRFWLQQGREKQLDGWTA